MNREPRRFPGSRKSIPGYNLPMSLPGQSLDIRLVVDRIPAFTWSAHPDGSVEFVNQRRREYAGLSAKESQGWGWQAAIHPRICPHYWRNGGHCWLPENQVTSKRACAAMTGSFVGS